MYGTKTQFDWWFTSEEKKVECMDNFRIARVTDPHQIKEYLSIKESGCCGEVDVLLPDSKGNLHMVGYNYGH